MKQFYFICFYITITLSSIAQSNSPKDTSNITRPSGELIYGAPEVEAKFPGGAAAWQKFLSHHFTYSLAAKADKIQGMVIVEFVVEADGSVTNIKAVAGPKELRADAENSLKKSPKWIPAVNNGSNVRSYKKQPIMFRIEYINTGPQY